MKIGQFIEDHEDEFVLCLMELECVLLAVGGILNDIVILRLHGII